MPPDCVKGRLWLVPNALDHGGDAIDIRQVLPDGVLQQAASLRHWVVEDARSARAFLKRVAQHHALPCALQEIAIAELPRPRKGSGELASPSALQALLTPAQQGHDLGLLSEAGLPAVADPGADLVAEAHRSGMAVVPLAGASALLLALAASGLNGQSFAFVGYLPQDGTERAARLRALEQHSRRERQTQLFIETPYRNPAMLATLLASLAPTTRLAVSTGLTLPQARVRSMSIQRWREAQTPDGLPASLPADVPAVFALLAA